MAARRLPTRSAGCTASEAPHSLARAAAGEAALVSGAILAGSLLVAERSYAPGDDGGGAPSSPSDGAFFYSRLYLALTLPAFFHVATIFALIWEDSSAVRLLGAAFVLSLQRVAVSAVVEEGRGNGGAAGDDDRPGGGDAAVDRARRSASRRGSARRRLPDSLPLAVGLILRLLVRKLMGPIDGRGHACAGIALPRSILFGMDSLCIE